MTLSEINCCMKELMLTLGVKLNNTTINDSFSKNVQSSMDSVLALLAKLCVFLRQKGVDFALENIPGLGQFLGQLFLNESVVNSKALYQATLKCIMGLYKTNPSTEFEKHSRKWCLALIHSTLCGKASTKCRIPEKNDIKNVETIPRLHIIKVIKKMTSALRREMKNGKSWCRLSSTYIPSGVDNSTDYLKQVVDILSCCPLSDDFIPLWEEFCQILQCFDHCRGAVKAAYSLLQKICETHKNAEIACMVWKNNPSILENEILNMCEAVHPFILSSNRRHVLNKFKLVNVSAEKADIHFIVTNVFKKLFLSIPYSHQHQFTSIVCDFFYVVGEMQLLTCYNQTWSNHAFCFGQLGKLYELFQNYVTEPQLHFSKLLPQLSQGVDLIVTHLTWEYEDIFLFSIHHSYWYYTTMEYLGQNLNVKSFESCSKILSIFTLPKDQSHYVENKKKILREVQQLLEPAEEGFCERKVATICEDILGDAEGVKDLLKQVIMLFLFHSAKSQLNLSNLLSIVCESEDIYEQLLCCLQTAEIMKNHPNIKTWKVTLLDLQSKLNFDTIESESWAEVKNAIQKL